MTTCQPCLSHCPTDRACGYMFESATPVLSLDRLGCAEQRDEPKDVREQVNRDLEERDHVPIMPQAAILTFRLLYPVGSNICGPQSLRRAVAEYMEHYHRERNQQGIDNRLIYAPAVVGANHADIRRRARLGGMLNFYY